MRPPAIGTFGPIRLAVHTQDRGTRTGQKYATCAASGTLIAMHDASWTILAVTIALHQRPDGARLTTLAGAVDKVTSRTVQSALRRLSELGLVERYGQRHPHYRLVQPHPAVPEFVALALRLPEPEQALSVVVRSSPAVWYAAAADDEFMIVQFDDAPEPAMAKLQQAIEIMGARGRPMPRVVRFPRAEFLRLLRVAIGFRVQALALAPIKGHLIARPAELDEPVVADGTAGDEVIDVLDAPD